MWIVRPTPFAMSCGAAKSTPMTKAGSRKAIAVSMNLDTGRSPSSKPFGDCLLQNASKTPCGVIWPLMRAASRSALPKFGAALAEAMPVRTEAARTSDAISLVMISSPGFRVRRLLRLWGVGSEGVEEAVRSDLAGHAGEIANGAAIDRLR